LINLAQSITTNNLIFDFFGHPDENSTFNMQFRAPQFQCTVSTYNHSIPLFDISPVNEEPFMPYLEFTSKWGSSLWDANVYTVEKHSIKSITVKSSPDNSTTYAARVETFKQSCKTNSMLYNITISFPRGVRKIEHTLSDARPMPDPVDIYDNDGSMLSMKISTAEPEALKEWKHRVAAAMQISNEWALLDALGDVLTFDWYSGAGIYCEQSEISENSTFTQDCLPIGYDGNRLPNNTGGKSSVLLFFSSLQRLRMT
jgi:hypothetical protein